MMKNSFYLLVSILLFCFTLDGVAQKQDKGKGKQIAQDTLVSFERFFKNGVQEFPGRIPIYRNGDKYYMEISDDLMGKDLLLSGVVLEGKWVGKISDITDPVYFEKGENNKLNVYKRICGDRIGDKLSKTPLAAALQNSSLQPVAYTLPIVASGKNGSGYVVDITKDLTATGTLFDFANIQWVNRPDPARSWVDTIIPVDEGVRFVVVRSQTEAIPGKGTWFLTSKIEWGIQLLPENLCRVRLADPRVGYETRTYQDYGKSPHDVSSVKLIRRWNLDIRPEDRGKYKRGIAVRPQRPIEVYIDDKVPAPLRPYVRKAIDEWSAAFLKIGLKDVFVVKEENPQVMIAPYQITISGNYNSSMEAFNTVSDPRTNELLGAMILLQDGKITEEIMKEFFFIGTNYPAVFEGYDIPELRGEVVRSRVAKLLGHCLGLTSNLAASYAYSVDELRNAAFVRKNGIAASVMDDISMNFVAQPEDKIALEDLFPKVSHYDYWAIEYGYKLFPGSKDENEDRERLESVLLKSKNNPKLFFSLNENDFRVGRGDLSNDPVEAARLHLRNVMNVYPYLGKTMENWTIYKDYSFMHFDGIKSLLGYWGAVVSSPFKKLGMRGYTPVIREYNDQLVCRQNEKEQQEIISYAEKFLPAVPDAFWEDDTLKYLTGESAEGWTKIYAKLILTHLYKAHRLYLQEELRGEGGVLAGDLDSFIRRVVFRDFNATESLTFLQRYYQQCYLSLVIKGCAKPDLSAMSDLDWLDMDYLQSLYKEIENLAERHENADERIYFQYLTLLMKQKIRDITEVKPKKDEGKGK